MTLFHVCLVFVTFSIILAVIFYNHYYFFYILFYYFFRTPINLNPNLHPDLDWETTLDQNQNPIISGGVSYDLATVFSNVAAAKPDVWIHCGQCFSFVF